MKLVIDISESDYKLYKSDDWHIPKCLRDALASAIPLPEDCGDLIDKSKISKAVPAVVGNSTGMGMSYGEMDAYNEGIDTMYSIVKNAKPIIKGEPDIIREIDKLLSDVNIYGPDWMYCIDYELSDELIARIIASTKDGEDSDYYSDLVKILKRIHKKEKGDK